jgi:hypothetical protein
MEDNPEQWLNHFERVFEYGDTSYLPSEDEIISLVCEKFKDEEKEIRNAILGECKLNKKLKTRLEKGLSEHDYNDSDNVVTIGNLPSNIYKLDLLDILCRSKQFNPEYVLSGGCVLRWGKLLFYCANYTKIINMLDDDEGYYGGDEYTDTTSSTESCLGHMQSDIWLCTSQL